MCRVIQGSEQQAQLMQLLHPLMAKQQRNGIEWVLSVMQGSEQLEKHSAGGHFAAQNPDAHPELLLRCILWCD